MKTGTPIKVVACTLMFAALFFVSVRSAAEDPIPFNAMMQSAGAQPGVPPKPDANDASSQSATSSHASSGTGEFVAGGILLGTGLAVVTATVIVVALVHGSAGHDGRVYAGIGGGAGVAGAGVALIVVGNHKRSKKMKTVSH